MENLNAEQIKKALECCVTPKASDCKDCGYRGKSHDNFIPCTNRLIADALALIASQEQRIKYLTEDNERLRSCVMSEEQVKTIAETTIKLGIDTIKADTVRKMQERLHERFKSDPNLVYSNYNIHRYIDQIAKEVLEGADED